MLNFQIVVMIYSFLRELFFDKKEEADLKSKHFKPKRWAAFLFTVMTTVFCVLMGVRLVNLAVEYKELKETYEHCLNNHQKTTEPLVSHGTVNHNKR